MSLSLAIIVLYLNYFGLIFGSFILFYAAVKLIQGGRVSLYTVLFASAAVAWSILCLTN